MSNRKAISKKMRFEIFKRDGFVCQYCGSHPPQVVLHVDHIIAVAKGGGNEMDNLITACSGCNLGKSARSLGSVPVALKDKAERTKESEEQIRGYAEIMAAKRQRIEEEAWDIVRIFSPDATRIDRKILYGIRRFIDLLGFEEVLDVADWAASNVNIYSFTPNSKAFLTFCKVCWKKIRERGEQNGSH